MSKSRKVSVVIPTWNAAEFVRRALECLAEQSYSGGFEVLVVDNGVQNDHTEIVTREFHGRIQELRYLRYEKQLGYAGAVNAGTLSAKYDLVAVTNNDNLPEPRWIHELVAEYERAENGRKEAIVSGLVDRPDFPDPCSAASNLWGRIVRPRGGRDPSLPPFHPDGSSFLFSRAAFGLPYDEEYFIYHEDVYIGWRAWLAGHEVRLAKAAKAKTFDGGSTRRIAYKTAYYSERNRWLNWLYFLSGSTLLKMMPLFLADAVAGIAFGRMRQARAAAWLSVASTLPAILQKRAAFQEARVASEREILPLLSGAYFSAEANNPVKGFVNFILRVYYWLFRLNFGK